MKHLININDLKKEEIFQILDKAHSINQNAHNKNVLIGKTIANLFFENSTRTLISFELAAKNLGATVINVNIAKSSTQKGETLRDTIQTLQAMGIDAFVIRHTENNICNQIKNWINHNTVLINAGDGNNQHPTQALLDCFTILQHKSDISKLKVSIIGDIKHSRVANSLVDCLHILGNRTINLYGPRQLLPNHSTKAEICSSFDQALTEADVIVMLRIQKERMAQHNIDELDNYHEQFGLNHTNLKLAKRDCIVMHPGPINRGVEITSELADNTPSVILEQVKNGVLIRQSVLYNLLT